MAFEKVAPEIDFCDLAAVVNCLKVVHCCYFGMKLVHCVHKSDARICKQEKKVQYVLRLLEIKGSLISESFSILKKCATSLYWETMLKINDVAHFLDDGAKVNFFSEIKPTLLGSTEINSTQERKKLSLNF